MATSNSSSNMIARQQGQVPVCGCHLPMRMWIASKTENRGKRFWKCINSGRALSCNLFVWDDDLEALQVRMVSVATSETVEPKARGCECNCGEVEAKKIKKLKQKLGHERNKIKWLQAILIVVIVFVSMEYLKK